MKAGDVVILKSGKNVHSPAMTVEKVTEEGSISCIYFRDYQLKEVEISEECLELVPTT